MREELMEEPRLDQIVREALEHAANAGTVVSFGLELTERVAKALEDAGELVDALSDEVRYETGQSPHVVEHIDRLCRRLGGGYKGYIGKWCD